jgi:zinc transporter ZupT
MISNLPVTVEVDLLLVLDSVTSVLAVLTAIAAVSAAVGVRLTSIPQASRALVPFAGGVLLGVAAFGIAPELAAEIGAAAVAWMTAGAAVLWMIDRYIYPVCPACAPTHDHESCSSRLHGFAAPLIVAAAVHNIFDGLAMTTAGRGLAVGVATGLALHKVPEGLALGMMLRAAFRSPGKAMVWAVATQVAMLAAGLTPVRVNERALAPFIALVGGSFLYLGFHAVHGEWKRRGTPAFMPALTGAAGAAALQHGLRAFLR